MTAEVAVLNREAAAIAADSAATLPFPRDVGNKVYNSANKIFELSEWHPVGIMIHGLGSYGLIPWETIVKMYRRDRGATQLNTIDEYAADFVQYLQDFQHEFTPDHQMRYALLMIKREIARIQAFLDEAATNTNAPGATRSHAQLRPMLFELIASRCEQLNKAICQNPIEESEVRRLIPTLFGDWMEYLGRIFTHVTTEDEIAEAATSLAIATLRSVPIDGFTTGLVVVGFGAQEIYPSWTHYSVGPVIADKLRACRIEHLKIDANTAVDIRTFAQDDMALTFLRGMHPELLDLLRGIVDLALGEFIRQLHQQIGNMVLPTELHNYITDIESTRETVLENFGGILEGHLRQEYYEPLESTVQRLPKEELANLAETLVGLTSLKRRMTPGLDSVGGPIDVALISKGDGLVWIKRKHYFDKELNMRYFERNRQGSGAAVLTAGGTIE